MTNQNLGTVKYICHSDRELAPKGCGPCCFYFNFEILVHKLQQLSFKPVGCF